MPNFGWSMPAGAWESTLPGEEDYPCAICLKGEMECECPECTECGAVGDLECYVHHGMVDSKPIKSLMDLARICYSEKPKDWQDALAWVKRGVYKYTTCGATFYVPSAGDNRFTDWPQWVMVAGYCEGSDGIMPAYWLQFPFSKEDWWKALEDCDKDAEQEWMETHACEKCWADTEWEGLAAVSERIPVNEECKNCGGHGAVI